MVSLLMLCIIYENHAYPFTLHPHWRSIHGCYSSVSLFVLERKHWLNSMRFSKISFIAAWAHATDAAHPWIGAHKNVSLDSTISDSSLIKFYGNSHGEDDKSITYTFFAFILWRMHGNHKQRGAHTEKNSVVDAVTRFLWNISRVAIFVDGIECSSERWRLYTMNMFERYRKSGRRALFNLYRDIVS